MAERAIELMRERMNSRTVFGKKLAEHGVPLQQIAKCRIKVQHSGNIQGTFREHLRSAASRWNIEIKSKQNDTLETSLKRGHHLQTCIHSLRF
jgi:alkylation response protein AidB-like acyl-CoA dehydrogenase